MVSLLCFLKATNKGNSNQIEMNDQNQVKIVDEKVIDDWDEGLYCALLDLFNKVCLVCIDSLY